MHFGRGWLFGFQLLGLGDTGDAIAWHGCTQCLADSWSITASDSGVTLASALPLLPLRAMECNFVLAVLTSCSYPLNPTG